MTRDAIRAAIRSVNQGIDEDSLAVLVEEAYRNFQPAPAPAAPPPPVAAMTPQSVAEQVRQAHRFADAETLEVLTQDAQANVRAAQGLPEYVEWIRPTEATDARNPESTPGRIIVTPPIPGKTAQMVIRDIFLVHGKTENAIATLRDAYVSGHLAQYRDWNAEMSDKVGRLIAEGQAAFDRDIINGIGIDDLWAGSVLLAPVAVYASGLSGAPAAAEVIPGAAPAAAPATAPEVVALTVAPYGGFDAVAVESLIVAPPATEAAALAVADEALIAAPYGGFDAVALESVVVEPIAAPAVMPAAVPEAAAQLEAWGMVQTAPGVFEAAASSGVTSSLASGAASGAASTIASRAVNELTRRLLSPSNAAPAPATQGAAAQGGIDWLRIGLLAVGAFALVS